MKRKKNITLFDRFDIGLKKVNEYYEKIERFRGYVMLERFSSLAHIKRNHKYAQHTNAHKCTILLVVLDTTKSIKDIAMLALMRTYT